MRARLIRGIAEGKTMTRAALDAGYGRGKNSESASSAASYVFRDPRMRAKLQEALDRAGATLDASARAIAKAHKADKTTHNGEMIPDHAIRLNAAELNLRSRGILGQNSDAESQAPILNISLLIQAGLKARGLREVEFAG